MGELRDAWVGGGRGGFFQACRPGPDIYLGMEYYKYIYTRCCWCGVVFWHR